MVRRELPAHRRGWLLLLSFVIPIGIWCFFTYVPAMQPFVSLTIAPEREQSNMAKYTVGSRVEKEYFRDYEDEVIRMNEVILEERADGTGKGSSRDNLKKIRTLEYVAAENGWLSDIDAADKKQLDERLFTLVGRLAAGEIEATSPKLSKANQQIVADNWQVMKAHAPYDPDNKVKEPLLHLLPQGTPASPVFLPAPHECIQAMLTDFTQEPMNGMPWMHERLWSSLQVVFGGFLLACLIGVPLGILCGSYDVFSRLFEPFTDFFRYMPAPTFGLLLIVLFGIERAPKIALVFVGTLPHLVLMLANTTRLLDRNLVEAAQTLGAKRTTLLTRVVIPGVVPKVYNDLRVLLGWAWTWLVIAELIGTKTGLTGFIDTQGQRRNFDRVFPVIIMIGVIGFLTDQFLQVLAHKLFPWEHTEKRQGFFATLWIMLTAWLPRRDTSAATQSTVEPVTPATAQGAADVPA